MDDTNDKIRRFFDGTLRDHPLSSAAVVGWSTGETQETRFRILSEIADVQGSSVLDVGCGVGDLYGYLSSRNKDIDYVGIDLHPSMIAHATRKFPDAVFLHQSLEKIQDNFDYIFVSGAFNLRLDNNEQYLERMINLMFSRAKIGVAFNLLSRYAPYDLVYSDLYYYDPGAVFSQCKKIANKVTLRHDYLLNDFSMYMYKS